MSESPSEMPAFADRPQHTAAELSRKQAVRQTMVWITERTPAAVVRFGEGEGRLLVADSTDSESVKVATNKIRWQTGLWLSPDDLFQVKSLIMKALDEADLVGIRGSSSFRDEHKLWVGRIAEVFEQRKTNRSRPTYVSHSLLNFGLLNALPSLIRRQRFVSVVSCRDVKAAIEAEYGVADVAVYQIPSQYIMRRVDGEYEAALHNVPIWPEFYDRLCSEIVVRQRGEVFLVGAGLFGKELCIRVRERGGIALDMGSSLDAMAHKVTRGPKKPQPYRAPHAAQRRSGPH